MKEGAYYRDLKQGTWITRSLDGDTVAHLNYAGGRLHGLCRWWADNGQLIAEEPYDHGVFHGTLRRWFADGEERQLTHFDHGTAFGDYMRRVREGKASHQHIRITGSYLNGKSHGTWTSHRGDGGLLSEGRFEHGSRVGTWRFWDRHGRLVKEIDYVVGGKEVVREMSKGKKR
jgi:antitoxin component YwqK of YwqJK toxin-antitoxin module